MGAHLVDPCAAHDALISIPEARRRAAAWAHKIRRTEHVGLLDAVGRALAQPVVARIANPRFDQSAMDGYAVCATSVPAGGAKLRVSGRIVAGGGAPALEAGTAARIFTGAPIPRGADAVIMQEHAERKGDHIYLRDAVRAGANIRRCGEDIREGEALLAAGRRIDARQIGLLATQGLASVEVDSRPVVAVVSTGNELRALGEALTPEAIFDSNKPMLLALARQAGLDVIDGGCVTDDPRTLAARLRELAEIADLIVTSGGVSVGEEDHSADAVRRAGGSVEELKIALKPGKPAAIGRIGEAVYLGLPGNPLAALVSWKILGGAIADALAGSHPSPLDGVPMQLASDFRHLPGRTEFVPARLTQGGCVEILGRGGSARLKPLADADGLAEIDAALGPVRPGDNVRFHAF